HFGVRIEVRAGPRLHRREQIDAGTEAESRWHDSDDHHRLVVERHRLAEYLLPAAEPPAPQPIAQNRHALPARRVFRVSESASQRRVDAERAEEILRHAQALYVLRFVTAGEIASRATVARITGHRLERLALLAPEEKLRLA